MPATNKQLTPDNSVHPGQVLRDALNKMGIKQKDLALRIDVTEKHISSVIQGKNSITADFAIRLERALNESAACWLERQRNFDEAVARKQLLQNAKRSLDVKKKILAEFDYADLIQVGYVPNATGADEKIIFLEQFFGVINLRLVTKLYPAAFKNTGSTDTNKGAVAAWLRAGQLVSSGVRVGSLDLKQVRRIASWAPMSYMQSPTLREDVQRIKKELANYGVVLLVMRQPTNSGIKGSTQWLRKRVVVQVSLHDQYADEFWFTLLHELAHVVLHDRGTFVDCDDSARSMIEQAADQQAWDWLIYPKRYEQIISRSDFSREYILNFSGNNKYMSGILVNRLQNDGLIPPGRFNSLRIKRRLSEEKPVNSALIDSSFGVLY
ncbi:MAG: HigA family addiction module antitoxin [Patescibacteria group bacterium]